MFVDDGSQREIDIIHTSHQMRILKENPTSSAGLSRMELLKPNPKQEDLMKSLFNHYWPIVHRYGDQKMDFPNFWLTAKDCTPGERVGYLIYAQEDSKKRTLTLLRIDYSGFRGPGSDNIHVSQLITEPNSPCLYEFKSSYSSYDNKGSDPSFIHYFNDNVKHMSKINAKIRNIWLKTIDKYLKIRKSERVSKTIIHGKEFLNFFVNRCFFIGLTKQGNICFKSIAKRLFRSDTTQFQIKLENSIPNQTISFHAFDRREHGRVNSADWLGERRDLFYIDFSPSNRRYILIRHRISIWPQIYSLELRVLDAALNHRLIRKRASRKETRKLLTELVNLEPSLLEFDDQYRVKTLLKI